MELLFREDAYERSCSAKVVAVGPEGIRLDRTVFYPTGGGQPGDHGRIVTAEGRAIAIIDARKGESGDDVVHVPPGVFSPKTQCSPSAGTRSGSTPTVTSPEPAARSPRRHRSRPDVSRRRWASTVSPCAASQPTRVA